MLLPELDKHLAERLGATARSRYMPNKQVAEVRGSLLAQSGHTELRCTCPLLGVKRTYLFALQMFAYDPKRTWPLPALSLVPVRWPILKNSGAGSETARVHQSYRWLSSRLAAGEFGSAACNTGNRVSETHEG